MGVQLFEENYEAIEIYQLVKKFGNVSFESLDRAADKLGVTGVDIFHKLYLTHIQFMEVLSNRRQQEINKNGPKRRNNIHRR